MNPAEKIAKAKEARDMGRLLRRGKSPVFDRGPRPRTHAGKACAFCMDGLPCPHANDRTAGDSHGQD